MIDTDLFFSSDKDDWSTPQWLYNQLFSEFHFTLDPCASNDNHKCVRYFTKEDDGLLQSWSNERVFCNPPYGRKIGLWVKKCYIHSVEGKGLAVMLIPARTDTSWFHDYIYNQNNVEVRFLKGRLKFSGAKYNAPFPSMIVVFNPVKNEKLFVEEIVSVSNKIISMADNILKLEKGENKNV